ncbi:hypothetical protein [Alkaliphilus sp. B6464]|uniref:hypothetical protein n=1 Tax=Alkaliphilus sp. B6464 TaxID=2731219 RepID=UPI001BAA4142|nr:hypothetical protein [Alkaliphilus sp. B6464]QUH22036.1 hypothetical protein HYG84_19210 [Alkaliphilus sp. B6464]
MKKILILTICLVLMIVFSVSVFGSVNRGEVILKTEIRPTIQKSYRYPYLGSENKISPDNNLYYIDFFDPTTEEFIKTQEVRYVDNFILREVYSDLPEKIFTYKPVSKEDYESYCDKYGYIEEKAVSMNRDVLLFTSLLEEGKTSYFFSQMFKSGLVWSIDSRTIELISILSNGEINNSIVIEKEFNESMIEVQNKIKELVLNDENQILDVIILPYESQVYKCGYTFYYKGDKEHPVITLFNNEVSMVEQLNTQLSNLNSK